MNLKSPINILIVDDEPLVREGLKTILKNLEHKHNIDKIGEASDGRKAVALMESQTFDIVFLRYRYAEYGRNRNC